MLNCKKCQYKNSEKCNCELQFEKRGTVFDHTMHALDALPDDASFELQIAALLHDIGKNEKTFDNVDGKCRFIGHEFLGSKMSKKRLEHLKFTSDEVNKITFLIEHHMDIHKLEDVSDKSLRRFIRNTGNYKDDLFVLVDADGAGTLFFDRNDKEIKCIAPKTSIQNRVKILEEELRKASEKPFRYFDGNELMKEFDIKKPCKEVGKLMQIQNDIIDEFGVNLDKEYVMEMIKAKYFE